MKRKNSAALLVVCLIGIFVTSCQKEVDFQDLGGTQPGGGNGGTNFQIIDDWSFIGLHAITNTTISVSQAGQDAKTVTVSDYVTENNQGALKITANQFIFTGISHTVNDEAHVKTYLNGILFDESDLPFNATTPPTDNTIDYTRNSNDSLTFTNAFAMLPNPSGGTTPAPTGPMGAKVSITGDTLTLTVKSSIYNTITQGGIPAIFDAKFESTMRFKRQ